MDAAKSPPNRRRTTSKAVSGVAEQLVNRIVKPLGLVILSRERIQETLDEAVKRGDVTRSDADELAGQLVRRGRQQTDELLGDLEQLIGRGRDESVDRLKRGADTARRKVGGGPTFPISGYDKLTATQIQRRLRSLEPPDLRKVRTHERRHANRKSVLAAIEKRLS